MRVTLIWPLQIREQSKRISEGAVELVLESNNVRNLVRNLIYVGKK